jgi:hypothetical protein
MELDQIQQYLTSLRAYAEDPDGDGNPGLDEDATTKERRLRLRAIEKAIRQLKKAGVAVPESLEQERLVAVDAIERIEQSRGGSLAVYEQLLDVVATLGRVIGRKPYRDLYLKARDRKNSATPSEVLREAIVATLTEAGGEAHWKHVLERVEDRLKERLTEVDLDRTKGKLARWQQAVRREARRMRNANILTDDSTTVWKLKTPR